MTTIEPVLVAEEEPPSPTSEEPPSLGSPRPAIWRHVSDAEWNDWRWQMRNRITRADQLRRVIHLTPDEEQAIALRPDPPLGITPYFASLMDVNDPKCPIRAQVVPSTAELAQGAVDHEDPLSEDEHSPVPGLVHRYPDRVLVIITDQCVAYCRHCTRRRLVGTGEMPVSRKRIDAMVEYLKRTPQVRDVLISGGDGLFISDEMLEYVLKSFRSVKTIEIVRIGTRVPIFLPQRITPKLLETIRKYHPFWINLHINHPQEMTPEVIEAIGKLADAGVPLGAQTVLLAGINDCVPTMKRLMHELVKARVRPYYLYQCDLSSGIGHFRTPVSVGIGIIEALRGHTSGFAVPTFVVDAPGGGGKIPVMPQYLISQNERMVVLRNFEGTITSYPEPDTYIRHDPKTCPECQRAARQKEEGVTAILSGQRLNLEPEGLSRQQRRHEIQGRADSTVFNALVKPLAEPSNNRHSNGNGHSNGHNGNGHKGTAQQSAIELVPMWPAADAMGLGEEAL